MGALFAHEIGHNFGFTHLPKHEDKLIQFRETYERKLTDGEWCMEGKISKKNKYINLEMHHSLQNTVF